MYIYLCMLDFVSFWVGCILSNRSNAWDDSSNMASFSVCSHPDNGFLGETILFPSEPPPVGYNNMNSSVTMTQHFGFKKDLSCYPYGSCNNKTQVCDCKPGWSSTFNANCQDPEPLNETLQCQLQIFDPNTTTLLSVILESITFNYSYVTSVTQTIPFVQDCIELNVGQRPLTIYLSECSHGTLGYYIHLDHINNRTITCGAAMDDLMNRVDLNMNNTNTTVFRSYTRSWENAPPIEAVILDNGNTTYRWRLFCDCPADYVQKESRLLIQHLASQSIEL